MRVGGFGLGKLALGFQLALWIQLGCTEMVHSKTTPEASAPAVIALQELPKEGQETYQLIFQGGPFPYEKDGVIFGNRERILPAAQRGFYREYTVRTPGEKSRGARELCVGAWKCVCQKPAFTRMTTTPVFEKSSTESDRKPLHTGAQRELLSVSKHSMKINMTAHQAG